jgi:catalase
VVDDPLLHARLFSYLDTQLTRLGGPNFSQIPINRPVAPVNDNNRDGYGQQAVHEGVAAYAPNSLGGGCPFAAVGAGSYTHVPRPSPGPKVKIRPASFDDHFSQATLFFRSMTPVEQDHIVGAFSFELAKCVSPGIRSRMVANLAQVDADLAAGVAAHLGIEAPSGRPIEPAQTSAALSMEDAASGPVAGRQVAVLVGEGTTARALTDWRKAADPLGVEIVAVGPRLGKLDKGAVADRTVHITQSVEYDGVVLLAEPDEAMAMFVQEAYRHHKTVGLAPGSGAAVAGVDADSAGVATGPAEFFDALALHRHWAR